MRKIDSLDFERFMQAMEQLAKEMDTLHQTKVADEIAMHGSELNEVYKKTRQLVKQLEDAVEQYFDTFDKAYIYYRQSVRHKSKIETKAREAAKRLAKKQAAKKRKPMTDNKQIA